MEGFFANSLALECMQYVPLSRRRGDARSLVSEERVVVLALVYTRLVLVEVCVEVGVYTVSLFCDMRINCVRLWFVLHWISE